MYDNKIKPKKISLNDNDTVKEIDALINRIAKIKSKQFRTPSEDLYGVAWESVIETLKDKPGLGMGAIKNLIEWRMSSYIEREILPDRKNIADTIHEKKKWRDIPDPAGSVKMKRQPIDIFSKLSQPDIQGGERVKIALDVLPARDKHIMEMRFLENYTLCDIAKSENVSKQFINKVIQRSIEKLKKIMDGG